MGGVLLGLLIFACAVALVVLFFPIRFRMDFGADENGGGAKFYIYKKNFYTWEKFRKGKSHGSDESLDDDEFAGKSHDDSTDKSREDSSSESHDEDSAVPEFVATAPAKPVEKKAAPSASSAGSLTGSGTSSPIEVKADAQEKTAPVETAKEAVQEKTAKDSAQDVAQEETAPKADDAKPAKEEKPAASAESAQPAGNRKPEKRDLTDFEFWTLVLTPDLDERGFRYVKRLLVDLVRLFNVKFENCFVEGIRADYKTMGYGAALNGVIKGFPFLKDWDLRMDWCNEKDLRVQGNILARTNLCRVLFYLLELALLAGIVFLIFWRRRARVLKTGELPELGFVRQKIRAFFVED